MLAGQSYKVFIFYSVYIKTLQKSRLPTCHQPVEKGVAVALLGLLGSCYGTLSLLMFHDFLSDQHHPRIFFASVAEFPGPGYKENLKCNLGCLF